uniref:AAA ATPase domain-containing protein n=1 Tax=Candidatus Kentrum sp. LFY TaxID=2126342 RepID=A0A450U7L7_9GAMM|nr:MAG: AAA ATPase domain-containing protein [Candidatus Kentron sp. LFY]
MADEINSSPEPSWRLFEELAVRLVSQAFKLQPGMILVTHKTKDGGYDGSISHDFAENDSVLGTLRELTFIEAKMRSGSQGIGLRDFAATLVVAHNEFANTLVVVANRPFTPQALEQACRFFNRTNMRVKLVDGATVSGWVRRNLTQLSQEFPKPFIESLVFDDPAAEQVKLNRFECSDHSRFFRNPHAPTIRSLTVETGWRDDNTLANCDLAIDANQPQARETAPPPLIGEERKKTLNDLASVLKARNSAGNICLLTGTGGVGKSVLVSHLISRLVDPDPGQRETWTGLVDVGRESSSRGLFVAILSALLGVDPRPLTTGGEDYWEPETLVSHLGGLSPDDPMCKAVARSLRADQRDYQRSWDLNVEPLLVFLGRIVRKRSNHQVLTLVFHELNRSTEEILDFLFQACRVLSENHASTLLEIRDSGYEQTANVRSPDSHARIMPVEQWLQTVKRFRSICSGGEYVVEPLSSSEAVDYLQLLLPGLGDQQASVIVDHVGKIPLHLKLTADWHKAEGILARQDGGIYLVEDLKRFFAGQRITPRSVDIIFDRLIEAWWSRPEAFYRQAITAMTTFQGQLTLTALEILTEQEDASALAESLLESGLFQIASMGYDILEVAHNLVLERMEAFIEKHKFGIGVIAEKLLTKIETIFPDPVLRNLRIVDLLLALGPARAMEACERAREAANTLAHTRDWTEASKYYEKACKALNGCTGSLQNHYARILELRNLADWLDVEILRYRIGSTENEKRLSAFLNLLAFSPDLNLSDSEYRTLELRGAIIEWRHYYVQERFDEALRAAARGRGLAMTCSKEIDVEVRGKALTNYAVTMKVKDKREDSFQAFDEALELLPDSYTVKAERLSNIAAFSLRNNPTQALEHYKLLLEVTRNSRYSFSEIIHAHVDIAMANFLMSDYPAAERDAQHAIKLAMDNGVPAEEARGRNILGCARWVRGNIAGADGEFQNAAFASERSISHRFLWRMRTNAAGTALEMKDHVRSYGLAHSAEDAIINPRQVGFPETGADPNHITSRWYAALIAIASYYSAMGRSDDLERIFKRTRLPHFKEHAQRFIDGDPAEEVFGETTHLRADRIMITG